MCSCEKQIFMGNVLLNSQKFLTQKSCYTGLLDYAFIIACREKFPVIFIVTVTMNVFLLITHSIVSMLINSINVAVDLLIIN